MAIPANGSQKIEQSIAPAVLQPDQSGWLRVGVIAAASALAGGLAAAWFYRKTLTRLQEASHAPAPEPPPPTDSDYEL
jgi:hypothetical protein